MCMWGGGCVCMWDWGGGVVCERMVWGDGCEYGMWGGGNISIEQMSQNNLLPQGKILTKS